MALHVRPAANRVHCLSNTGRHHNPNVPVVVALWVERLALGGRLCQDQHLDGALDMTAATRRAHRPSTSLLCQAVAIASALVAGLAVPVHPSGVEVVDRLLAAGYVGVVALAGARARRWSWLVLAVPVGVFAGVTWAVAASAVAIVLSGAGAWRHRPLPEVGSVVGALGAVATLRLTDGGITGASLALGVVAVGPFLRSGYQQSPRSARRTVRLSVGCGTVAVLLIGLFYGAAVLSARSAAERGVQGLNSALAAGRSGDVELADKQFKSAQAALAEASRSLDAWWATPARAVPVLGHNARTASTAVDVAGELTGAASGVVSAAGSESLGMRDGRFDPAAFEELRAPLGRLQVAVGRAEVRVEGLDSPWLVGIVTRRLTELRTELRRAQNEVDIGLQAVDAVPALLGAGGERTYLVLFVTPVEARATGFIGNFAELTVRDGRFSLPRFGRTGEIKIPPEPKPSLDLPPEFLDRYLRFGIRQTFTSATATPDFPSVARLTSQLYAQSGGRKVDGVLSVDPEALASLLRFAGPVTVPGIDKALTADTAAQFLLRDQYVDFSDKPGRVDALEFIGRTTFSRLTQGSLPPPQKLVAALGKPAAAGNLRLAVFDEAPARFLARIGIDHALTPPVADAIAVTTTNVIGGKQDLFLQRTVDYDAKWDPSTGAVSATLRVTMRNDTPSSGLPDYVIRDAIPNEDVPRGTNRSRVAIYTPWDLKAATLDGRSLAVEHTLERGYHVYGTSVELAPKGGTATFEVQLEGRLALEHDYELSAWNQVLARPDQLRATVEVAGKRRFETQGLATEGRRASVNEALTARRRYRVHVLDTGRGLR